MASRFPTQVVAPRPSAIDESPKAVFTLGGGMPGGSPQLRTFMYLNRLLTTAAVAAMMACPMAAFAQPASDATASVSTAAPAPAAAAAPATSAPATPATASAPAP